MSIRTFGRNGYLTTGELAAMIGCSLRHAGRLADRGAVKSFMIPGSKHRRISASSVLKLLTDHGIPIPPQLAALVHAAETPPLVIYVAAASEHVERFVVDVQAVRPNAVWASGSLIDTSFRCGQQSPDAVLFGTDEGLEPAVIAAKTLLGHTSPPRVAMVLDDATDEGDSRLDGVRDRLSWLGRNPGSWTETITMLNLQQRKHSNGTDTTQDPGATTLWAC